MTARGTAFRETMLGRVHLHDEDRDRPVRVDLVVRADAVLLPHRTTRARLTGRVRIAGRADDAEAVGELEISPLARRRIRYRITFALEGRSLVLDGWKSVSPARPVTSMTVLPFTLYEDGERVGEGTLRFPLTTGLLLFLASFRFPRAAAPAAAPDPASRWDGTPCSTGPSLGKTATQPLVFLRLLHNGRTWPRRVERTAVGWVGSGRFRADIGLPEWRVAGRVGRRRIRVTVTQPPERTLALTYTDPDGSAAVCRNSERADAEVSLEHWWGKWRQEAVWRLSGTAHAEVGDR